MSARKGGIPTGRTHPAGRPADAKDITPSATGAIDAANDVLSIQGHGFSDGQELTYSPNGNDPIDGLEGGKTCLVELTGVADSANQFKLRDPLSGNLVGIGTGTPPEGDHSFVFEKTKLAFNPTTAVDGEKDTIHFSSAHGLSTGDAVTYRSDPSETGTHTQDI